MGALEAPQDRHRDIHKTGPPERNRQTEAKVEQGAQEAKAGGPSWPWPRPSARPLQLGPLYPPKKNPWGSSGVSGALRGETHSKHDNVKKTLGHSLVNIRPRPAGLSIWQRPAGETITGWLDNNGSSRLA